MIFNVLMEWTPSIAMNGRIPMNDWINRIALHCIDLHCIDLTCIDLTCIDLTCMGRMFPFSAMIHSLIHSFIHWSIMLRHCFSLLTCFFRPCIHPLPCATPVCRPIRFDSICFWIPFILFYSIPISFYSIRPAERWRQGHRRRRCHGRRSLLG